MEQHSVLNHQKILKRKAAWPRTLFVSLFAFSLGLNAYYIFFQEKKI